MIFHSHDLKSSDEKYDDVMSTEFLENQVLVAIDDDDHHDEDDDDDYDDDDDDDDYHDEIQVHNLGAFGRWRPQDFPQRLAL